MQKGQKTFVVIASIIGIVIISILTYLICIPSSSTDSNGPISNSQPTIPTKAIPGNPPGDADEPAQTPQQAEPGPQPENQLVRGRLPIFFDLSKHDTIERFGEPDSGGPVWNWDRDINGSEEKLKVTIGDGKHMLDTEWVPAYTVPIKSAVPEEILNTRPIRFLMNENNAGEFVAWIYYDKVLRGQTKESFAGNRGYGVTVWIGGSATSSNWRSKKFNEEKGDYEWTINDWKSYDVFYYFEAPGEYTGSYPEVKAVLNLNVVPGRIRIGEPWLGY